MRAKGFCTWMMLLFVSISAPEVSAESPRADSCDVTWLWPAPRNVADAGKLLDMESLRSSDGKPVWSDTAFADLLALVDGAATTVGSDKVSFSSDLRKRGNWKIAGVRIDPTAPGGHRDLRNKFGESPQIRLVVQPVVGATVHDVAVHLVFSYVSARDGMKNTPDRDKFKAILADLMAMKQQCSDAGIQTTGVALGVHPGFKSGADRHDGASERIPESSSQRQFSFGDGSDGAKCTGTLDFCAAVSPASGRSLHAASDSRLYGSDRKSDRPLYVCPKTDFPLSTEGPTDTAN